MRHLSRSSSLARHTGALRLSGSLLYLNARVYDTETRRFLSADSVDLQRYAYTGGDPVNFTDPSGMLRPDGGFPGWAFGTNPNFLVSAEWFAKVFGGGERGMADYGNRQIWEDAKRYFGGEQAALAFVMSLGSMQPEEVGSASHWLSLEVPSLLDYRASSNKMADQLSLDIANTTSGNAYYSSISFTSGGVVTNYVGDVYAELVLAMAGAVGGALVNGFNAYSTGGDVWKGAIVGGISGFIAGYVNNPFLAGAIAGGLTTFLNRQAVNRANTRSFGQDMILGIGGGLVGGGLGGWAGGAFGQATGGAGGAVARDSLGKIGSQVGGVAGSVWMNNAVNWVDALGQAAN